MSLTGLRQDLRRSRVTDGHVSSGRTSYSCFLTNDKVRSRRGSAGRQLSGPPLCRLAHTPTS